VPPFIPLPDGALVEVGFEYPEGLVVENLLWFINHQPPTTLTQLQALSDGVAAWHADQLLPHLSAGLTLVAVLAEKWDTAAGDIHARTDVNAAGSDGSGIHSANVSFRVRFKGSSALPRTYNSNFLAGIPRGQVATNLVSPGFVDAVFNAYVNLIDLADGFGPFPAWEWVVTSRRLDNAWRSVQAFARTDFIQTPNIYVSPRRRRITNLKKLLAG